MAAQEKAVPDLPRVPSAGMQDLTVVCVANGSASPAISFITSLVPFGSIPVGNTPANSSSSTVSVGRTWTDGNYFYVATSNNVVKRAALTSF